VQSYDATVPGWWDKLMGRHATEPTKEPQPRESAKWLAANARGNPFGVPLLDLMQLQGLTSLTSDPENAERSVSWGGSTGAELDVKPLVALPPLDCALRYPAAEQLPDGILYAPPSMDWKWIFALREGRVIAARSWTGTVQAIADTRRDGDALVLERLRVLEPSALLCSNLVEVFDWLLRAHVWDQRLPLPVDDAAADMLEKAPLWGFSTFGKALFCAAKSWRPPPPPRPLRSDGEVIVAARLNDVVRLERAAEQGLDLDAPGTFGGYTALHFAAVRGDVALFETLVKLGANPAAIADRGMNALGIAVVHKAPLAFLDAVAKTSLDLELANTDGFTALHGAAEADAPAAVPWLVAHGLKLEARTNRGHTPLHIASGLGNAPAAKALLAAGADPDASSPGGTPLEVARAENKAELVALLSAVRR
jgi:hypothetical protein